MADDDDVIAVDIVPVLNVDATDREMDKLRDRFKDGARGAGKVIGDAMHSELADELRDEFGPTVDKWVKDFAADVGAEIGGTIHDGLESIGIDIEGITDKTRAFAEKTRGLADTFRDFKAGDLAHGFDDLAQVLGGKLPGPLQTVADKSKTVQDTLEKLKNDTKGTLDEFSAFAEGSPRIAQGFETIGKAMGPVAILMGTLASVDKDFGNNLDRLLGDLKNHDYGDALKAGGGLGWDSLKMPFDLMPPSWNPFGDHTKHTETTIPIPQDPAARRQFFKDHGINPQDPNLAPEMRLPPEDSGGNWFSQLPGTLRGTPAPSAPPPSFAPPDVGGAHTSGSVTGGMPHITLADFTTPSDPSSLYTTGAGVANLYRFAESLVGTPYSQALRNDCSGMVSELANVAVGLPPPGADGRFSTTNEGPRLAAMGFRPGMGGPNDLSIGWYDHGGGNLGHTAATLPGGVNAESGGSHGSFLLGAGAAGASSPQFDHHAYLPMGMPTGGGFGVRPAGFGAPGAPGAPAGPGVPFLPGLPDLGAYAPQPTTPNSYTPTQQPGLGHGSGVGVGGGIIGLAEQAGAMAAGAFSFGGGAIAAQIAEQEINLAVQKGGQAAATVAMAPFETLGLHGGQMGAPSVSPGGGWIGKILGGLVGQQTNFPNVAGATAAPRQQPQQHEETDPAGGNAGKPGGGPTGSKDDPMHVKNVSPASAAPQGTATSAGSMTGYMSSMTV